MSSTEGQVRFHDGVIMFCRYDGTCDFMVSALFETSDELCENWRKEPDRECNCEVDEVVELACDYGGGQHWQGTACKKCKTITSGFEHNPDPYYDGTKTYCKSGKPDWWVEGDYEDEEE